MQRWVRLPQGGFLDASHVIFIGKIESFAKLDDEGHAAGKLAQPGLIVTCTIWSVGGEHVEREVLREQRSRGGAQGTARRCLKKPRRR